MPWRAVITRPVPRPATAGACASCRSPPVPARTRVPASWGEPARPGCPPPAGRIGRPSCGGAGRSVKCSGPGISAALDRPEDQPNPGIPQVKAAQGMPAGLDLRRTLRGHLERHQEPPAGGARDMTARILSRRNRSWARSSHPARPEAVARPSTPGQPRRLRPQPRGQTACSTSPPYTSGSSGCSRSARRLNSWNPGSASCSLCAA